MPVFTPADRLAVMVAAAEEPVLSADELADLLKQAQRPDSTGLNPTDVGWTPTYDLNAAAAEGWRWKAGKVSPNYSFGIDRGRDEQSDVFKHCMAMAAQYTTGGSGSAKVPSMIDDFDITLP
jgi:hypothetical protein